MREEGRYETSLCTDRKTFTGTAGKVPAREGKTLASGL